MKQYILIISWIFILISCNNHSKHWETITAVETFIEKRPDSALISLQKIDLSELSGKEEKAKYALLYSMALDKNLIDKIDFTVLQPAIDYYDNNGSSTDKLRTFYYQGRIYQNKGNNTLAMKCYVNAISEGNNSDDVLTKARLYVAQSNIYYSLYEWDKVCELNLKAAEYFYQANRISSYVNCLLKSISGFIQAHDFENAETYLSKCKPFIDTIPTTLLSVYYSEYIIYLTYRGTDEEIKNIISTYKVSIPEELIDYATISKAYLKLGEYDNALTAILKVKKFSNLDSEMRYHSILTSIYQSQGNYKDALKSCMRFYEVNDSVTLNILKQDTQFIEERYALELENIKEKEAKNTVILLSIILGIVLIAVIIYIRNRLKVRIMMQSVAEKETERYKTLYQQIEYEKENLTELLSQEKNMDIDVKNIVTKRIELLNKFFTVYITNNSDISCKVYKELDDLLADKDSFMASTKLAFAGSHPNFIKYLVEHKLTEREIEYCCLYALGLKGKEVGSYIKMRSHYNISSDIREKLGLDESDTNLGIYIRKLLSSL